MEIYNYTPPEVVNILEWTNRLIQVYIRGADKVPKDIRMYVNRVTHDEITNGVALFAANMSVKRELLKSTELCAYYEIPNASPEDTNICFVVIDNIEPEDVLSPVTNSKDNKYLIFVIPKSILLAKDLDETIRYLSVMLDKVLKDDYGLHELIKTLFIKYCFYTDKPLVDIINPEDPVDRMLLELSEEYVNKEYDLSSINSLRLMMKDLITDIRKGEYHVWDFFTTGTNKRLQAQYEEDLKKEE